MDASSQPLKRLICIERKNKSKIIRTGLDQREMMSYLKRLTRLVKMVKDFRLSPENVRRQGSRMAAYGGIALVCTLVGILVASNFDLTPRTVADVPTNIAQTGAYPVVDRDGKLESPFVTVVDQAANAVVNISARTPNDQVPWWVRGSAYSTSMGSGFFFRKDGYIITNNHVVSDAVALTVRTASGYEYQAQMVGSDPQTDLAVIKVTPEEEITVIPFGSSEEISVGDWAIAIGNPFPQQGLDRTVTVGVVSAKGRHSLNFGGETPQYQDYIQTDAAINPGNSGGPLLNLRGECIGVNAAITSPTGTSIGIGFAVPIDIVRAIVPDLIEHGKPSRGWLGVQTTYVSEREAKRQGLAAVRGVLVDSVLSDSPAQRAGIRGGDIIVKFDNREVESPSQFQVLVATVQKGNAVPVEVVRNGERVPLTTTVGDRDTYLARTQDSDQGSAGTVYSWLGMDVVDFTPQIAQEIGAEHVEGLYVLRVYPGSPAYVASVEAGSVIVKVDNESVASVRQLQQVVNKLDASKTRLPLIVLEPNGAIGRKVLRP
jgi:serine protease Do